MKVEAGVARIERVGQVEGSRGHAEVNPRRLGKTRPERLVRPHSSTRRNPLRPEHKGREIRQRQAIKLQIARPAAPLAVRDTPQGAVDEHAGDKPGKIGKGEHAAHLFSLRGTIRRQARLSVGQGNRQRAQERTGIGRPQAQLAAPVGLVGIDAPVETHFAAPGMGDNGGLKTIPARPLGAQRDAARAQSRQRQRLEAELAQEHDRVRALRTGFDVEHIQVAL